MTEIKVDIIRVENNPVEGTFGVLLLEGRAFCVCLEETQKTTPYDSRIPAGNYTCERYLSPSKHIEVWELQHVQNRTHVQIHAGNTLIDTLGCILLGQYWDKLRGNRAVLNSGATFEKFMQITRNVEKLNLTIKEI